jgi:hypothetical protein
MSQGRAPLAMEKLEKENTRIEIKPGGFGDRKTEQGGRLEAGPPDPTSETKNKRIVLLWARAETGSTSSRPARSLMTPDAEKQKPGQQIRAEPGTEMRPGELGVKNESCPREREDQRWSEASAQSPAQENERASLAAKSKLQQEHWIPAREETESRAEQQSLAVRRELEKREQHRIWPSWEWKSAAAWRPSFSRRQLRMENENQYSDLEAESPHSKKEQHNAKRKNKFFYWDPNTIQIWNTEVIILPPLFNYWNKKLVYVSLSLI